MALSQIPDGLIPKWRAWRKHPYEPWSAGRKVSFLRYLQACEQYQRDVEWLKDNVERALRGEKMKP